MVRRHTGHHDVSHGPGLDVGVAMSAPTSDPVPIRSASTASNAIKEQCGDYRRVADIAGYVRSGDK
jgi:hypothetical protein